MDLKSLMAKRIQFIIFLVILLTASAYARCRIEGKVLDVNGKPLTGVNILIEGTSFGAATDDSGYYFIPDVPCGKYRVIASVVGYKSVSRRVELFVDGVLTLNMELRSTAIPMGEVIVTATKTERLLSDIPVSANVVTKEEIELANVETAFEAVKHLPGVNAQGGFGWSRGGVKLHGLSPQYALVLLDGQRLHGGPKYSVDLSQYPVEMIERVEVIKGPASALYGSDAMSGVINVITRATPNKLMGSATAVMGTYDTRIYKLSQGSKIGKFGYFLNYTDKESDGLEPEWDKFKDRMVRASLGYNFSSIFKFALKSGYFEREQMIDPLEQKRYSLNSLWEWKTSKTSKLKLRASLFHYSRFWYKGGYTEIDVNYNNYEAELNYHQSVKNLHLLTVGYNYFKEEHIFPSRFDTSHATNSLFAQDEMDFRPFSLTIGTRIDYHSEWGREVNPNVGLVYRLTENLKLKGSVGKAFKSPPISHLYTDDYFKRNRWLRANPDLKPEKSIGYQLGVNYRIIRVTYFRNDIKDLIETYDTGETKMGYDFIPYPIHSYENIAESYGQGVEFAVCGQFKEWLGGRLGYTWLDAKDKETKEELFYNPRHKLNLELEYKLRRYGLGINLRGEYIGKRYGYYVEPGGCGCVIPDELEELASYSIVHIKVNKAITKYAHVFVAMKDVINGTYAEWGLKELSKTAFKSGIKLKF